MVKVTVNDNGKITETDAIAYIVIAFEDGAPRYGSTSMIGGDFDEDMLEYAKQDFKAMVEDEESEDSAEESPDYQRGYKAGARAAIETLEAVLDELEGRT